MTNFDEVVPRYYKRFDKVIAEDNVIYRASIQWLELAVGETGPFLPSRALVHVIDNWVLDHVLPPIPTSEVTP